MHELAALLPYASVIVLAPSAGADEHDILHWLMAGATGYLLMPLALDRLMDAINRAPHGSPVLCTEAQKALLACLHRAGRSVQGTSSREQQVLTCLLEGLSDKQVGLRLGISTNTAHVHLVRLFRKLGVHTRAEAVRHAISVEPRL